MTYTSRSDDSNRESLSTGGYGARHARMTLAGMYSRKRLRPQAARSCGVSSWLNGSVQYEFDDGRNLTAGRPEPSANGDGGGAIGPPQDRVDVQPERIR